MNNEFPPRLEGKFYLTEGGTETEVMYKWGYELPEFAMFPLLDNPEADAVIRNMYRRYLDVAAEQDTGLILNGHDYRASPDWGAKLGIVGAGSCAGLGVPGGAGPSAGFHRGRPIPPLPG